MTDRPEILFTRDAGAKAPTRGRKSDIAHDMFTNEDAFILPDRNGATVVKSGIHTAFDPEQYGLFISPRSGMMKYPLALANSTGLIEGEYRGDVGFPLRNTHHLGFAPQSKRVLTIDDNGVVVGVPVNTMVEDELIYSLYVKELEKLVQDFTVLYDEKMAKNFHEAILKKDLDGDYVVPAGTFFLPKGTRIAQAYLIDRKDPIWIEVPFLPTSDRGTAGYGSSGVN